MFITKIEIENIRSLEKVVWEIEPERAKGWHVVLGDNGAGKSTFLRAAALAVLGRDNALALRQNFRNWVTFGKEIGAVEIHVDTSDFQQKQSRKNKANKQDISTGILIASADDSPVSMINLPAYETNTDRKVFFESFSASYGPSRRFANLDSGIHRRQTSNPELNRHLSLFEEDFALNEILGWLESLKFKSLEKLPEGALLDQIYQFINWPGFLPQNVQLKDVSSNGVRFEDSNGKQIFIEELSSGYRSFLCMTFEIMRQMVLAYGYAKVFDSADPSIIIASGFVLVDEIDVHLHPSWQREVGQSLIRHFPNIQFIVTTHSPLVCQAAGSGSIFRLPTPGTDETGRMVTGVEFDRLVNGDVLEAYETPAFGMYRTRSDESSEKLKRLIELNVLEFERTLTKQEKAEQKKLRDAMPTMAYALSPDPVENELKDLDVDLKAAEAE